jgi:hypothetical protein
MPECHQGFTLMQTQGLRLPPQPRYLSKSPKKKLPPPGPPMELRHRQRCSISRALSTYLSKSPVQSPLYISLEVPSPGSSLHIPRSPQSRALYTYLSKSPVQGHLYISLEVPSPGPSLQNSQSPQKRNPPPGSPYRVPT